MVCKIGVVCCFGAKGKNHKKKLFGVLAAKPTPRKAMKKGKFIANVIYAPLIYFDDIPKMPLSCSTSRKAGTSIFHREVPSRRIV